MKRACEYSFVGAVSNMQGCCLIEENPSLSLNCINVKQDPQVCGNVSGPDIVDITDMIFSFQKNTKMECIIGLD